MDKQTRLDWSGVYARQYGTAGTSGTHLYTNSKVGFANPGWKQRMKWGWFVASPYTLTNLRIEAEAGSCGLRWQRLNNGIVENVFTTFSGMAFANSLGVPSVDPFSVSDYSKAIATADSRLHSKIRAENSEMNGMLALGELRETIKMIRSPAQGLVRLLKTYATSAKRLAKSAKNRRAFEQGIVPLYLEHAFGWTPLLNDIGSLSSTVARIILDDHPIKRVSTQVDGAPYSSVNPPSLVGPFDLKQRFSSVTTAEFSIRATAYLRERFYGPLGPAQRVAELSGFTLENFVPTVYNLIPYSFVVDYFTNLGDVIEGATTYQGNVLGYVRTKKSTTIRRESLSFDAAATIAAVAGFNHSPFGDNCGRVKFSLVRIERVIGTSVPVPDLVVTLPGAKQVTNMAALVVGFFSGIQPPRR